MVHYTPEQRTNAFWDKVAITADDNLCWEWRAGKTKKGYGKIGEKVNKKTVMYLAHRIAWQYPDYIIPKGMLICHSCDNPACCNPKHLFIGTHKDNSLDMHSKGREARGEKVSSPGEKNPNAKLTLVQVKEIRCKYSNGMIIAALAREYKISERNIGSIVKGRIWK